MMILDFAIDDARWEEVPDIERLISNALHHAMDHLGFKAATSELSLLLTDDEAISALNAQWRHKDGPTNVLSFPALDLRPGEQPGPLLGDIVLARQTIAREAQQADKSLSDHVQHLAIHGLLHLLGYDHENDEDAEIMEALEKDILLGLGIKDPYMSDIA